MRSDVQTAELASRESQVALGEASQPGDAGGIMISSRAVFRASLSIGDCSLTWIAKGRAFIVPNRALYPRVRELSAN